MNVVIRWKHFAKTTRQGKFIRRFSMDFQRSQLFLPTEQLVQSIQYRAGTVFASSRLFPVSFTQSADSASPKPCHAVRARTENKTFTFCRRCQNDSND
jgi:hypothetical protein